MRGGFKVEVGLHQALAPSTFLFVLVMDRLSDEVRQESLWTLRIADNILNCSGRRKWVEERWRCVCVCICAREKRNECQQKKDACLCKSENTRRRGSKGRSSKAVDRVGRYEC